MNSGSTMKRKWSLVSVNDDHYNLDIDIVFCVDWSSACWLRGGLLSNDRWEHGIGNWWSWREEDTHVAEAINAELMGR
jgi:hypothetical protein